MTSTKNDGGEGRILKQDELGWVRTPLGKKAAILDQLEASGMSGIAFAAHVRVKYPTFARWLQQDQKVQSLGRAAQRRAPESRPRRRGGSKWGPSGKTSSLAGAAP